MAQVVVTIVAQDVLDLAIAEAAALVAAGLTAEDTLDLAIAEAAEVVALGVIEKVAADTLGLAIVEAPNVKLGRPVLSSPSARAVPYTPARRARARGGSATGPGSRRCSP